MAAAIGAIREFLHLFSDDWLQHDDAPRHITTILDVLEPRDPQH